MIASMRAPRRNFAASLVVTIAALPACGRTVDHREPVHPNPPPTTDNDPRDHRADPNAPDPGTTWRVVVDGVGTCTAMRDMECPEGASCNPPEPPRITCPDGADKIQYSIRAQDDGTCVLVAPPPECPHGVACNPPPPHKVDCPKY